MYGERALIIWKSLSYLEHSSEPVKQETNKTKQKFNLPYKSLHASDKKSSQPMPPLLLFVLYTMLISQVI